MDLTLATFLLALVGGIAAVATWLFGDRLVYRALARIPRKPPVLSVHQTSIYSSNSGRGPLVTVYVRNMTNAAMVSRDIVLLARGDGGPTWKIALDGSQVEGRLAAHAMTQTSALIRPIDSLCEEGEWFTLTVRGNVAGKDRTYSVRLNRALTVEVPTRRHVPFASAPEWVNAKD